MNAQSNATTDLDAGTDAKDEAKTRATRWMCVLLFVGISLARLAGAATTDPPRPAGAQALPPPSASQLEGLIFDHATPSDEGLDCMVALLDGAGYTSADLYMNPGVNIDMLAAMDRCIDPEIVDEEIMARLSNGLGDDEAAECLVAGMADEDEATVNVWLAMVFDGGVDLQLVAGMFVEGCLDGP